MLIDLPYGRGTAGRDTLGFIGFKNCHIILDEVMSYEIRTKAINFDMGHIFSWNSNVHYAIE